ncbi:MULTISPECIES: OprD family outer membrane porin [unclassified Acinetobacter]|uniref:OprD family outer membrane porin n=1 Tax=unclassified Acinetobacter TaxID=196816 RepID=UPI0029341BCD|nr:MULTISPECIES: OprD family outer membrane porin [unclassified Acinetobacter]WOE32613.1 OprD family outer membrane porin [Acinetobacter sp. SAAs470]WOE38089.1 OprD family outer membrane porin [Acinetobacter sp. SAAs474]
MKIMMKKGLIKTYSVCVLIGLCGSEVAIAGFIENSETSVYLRNFYLERDFKDSPNPNLGSWSQGVTLRFNSGYTDTPLQVGLDAGVQYALRLSDHNDERPDTVLPFNSNKGRQDRDYTKFGATLKFKYKDSELRIGELLPRTPVVYIDDSRQLVTTYEGLAFESKAIKNLKFSAGRITRINARNDDRYEKLSLSVAANVPRYESDGLNYIGFDYNFKPNLSGSYWYAQLEDIYQQHYLNLAYSLNLGPSKLKFDARYFNNSEAGDAYYGKIDSDSLGGQVTLLNGAHTLTAGVQKNNGDSMFPTLAGYAPQPYLQTWSLLGFIKPNELTWHALYSYDFKDIGLPGFRATARYLHGSKISRPNFKDNTETEANLILGYVVPEGMLKGLGLEWRHIRTTTKYGAGNTSGTDFNENRIITSYTYKF